MDAKPTFTAKPPQDQFAKMADNTPGNFGLMAGPNGPHVHLDGKAREFKAGDSMLTFQSPQQAAHWASTHGYNGAVLTQRRDDGGSANFDGFAPLWSQGEHDHAAAKVGAFRAEMRQHGAQGGPQ